MKKISMIFLIAFALSALCVNVYAQDNLQEPLVLKIIIDGRVHAYNNPPVIVNGRTLLPLREIMSDLGIPYEKETISWNSLDESIHINYNLMDVKLRIGETCVILNGQEQTIDVGPMIISDITYVPVRFISQVFGKKVIWDSISFCVLITDQVMYNVVSDIIIKSRDVTDQILKYKSNMLINVVMSVPSFDLNYNMSMSTMEMKDRSKEYLYSLEETTLQDNSKTTIQTYYADHSSYTADNSEIWKKKQISDTEWGAVFNGEIKIGTQDNIEKLCAALQLKSSDSDEILLAGNIYLPELFQKMGKDASSGELRIDGSEVEIVIDKNTFFTKTYRMNVQGEMRQNDQPINYNSDILLTYSELNGNVDIELPKELK